MNYCLERNVDDVAPKIFGGECRLKPFSYKPYFLILFYSLSRLMSFAYYCDLCFFSGNCIISRISELLVDF